MNSMTVFNVTAALVMGGLGAGALFLDRAAAHDICLAVISGLTGALAGGASAKLASPPQQPKE